MALQRAKFAMPLVAGIDLKTDAKQVKPPHLLDLQNAVLDETGKAKKRRGMTGVPLSLSSGYITKMHNVWTHRDEVLVAGRHSNGVDYVWALKGDGSLEKVGLYTPCTIKHMQGCSARVGIVYADAAVVGSKRVLVHMDYNNVASTYESLLSIYDDATGTMITEREALSEEYYPQVHAVNDSVAHVYTLDSTVPGDIKLDVWDVDSATNTATVTVAANAYRKSSCYYRDANYGDCTAVMYWDGTNIVFKCYDSTGALKRTLNITGEVASCFALSVNHAYDAANDRYYLAACWCDGSNNLRYIYLSDYMVPVAGPLTVTGLVAPAVVSAIAREPRNDTTKQFLKIYVSLQTGTPAAWQTVSYNLAYDGSTITTGGAIYNYEVCSQAFTHGDCSRVMLWGHFGSGTTALDNCIMGKFDKHGGAYEYWVTEAVVVKDDYNKYFSYSSFHMASSSQVIGDRVIVGVPKKVRLVTDRQIEAAPFFVEVDMAPGPLPAIEAADGLIIGGGLLHLYDGTLQEAAYIEPPHVVNLTATADATGVFSGGESLQYCCVFEWTDRNGRVHRSQPSAVKSITIPSSGGPYRVDVKVNTYQAGGHWQMYHDVSGDHDRRKLVVHVYRTTDAGTVFYKLDEWGTDNDLGNPYVTVADNNADSTIIDNEVLYTTGGILANANNFASHRLAQVADRVYAVPSERPELLTFSKSITPGLAIEFADEFLQDTYQHGEVQEIGATGEYIIIGKENTILLRQATGGPNAAGVGQFPPIRVLTDNVGILPGTVMVQTPKGLLASTPQGIHLISPSGVVYVAQDIERDYRFDSSIISGCVEPKTQKVLLHVSQYPNRLLVWDYSANRWYTWNFSLPGPVLALAPTADGDTYVAWDAANPASYGLSVYDPDSAAYQDFGLSYNTTIDTGWINLGELSGYQRVWWVYLVGDLPSQAHIDVFYDYDDTAAGETFDLSGLSGDVVRFMVSRQRCRAIRLKVRDTSVSAEWSLSRIEFEIGTTQRPMKLRPSLSV